MPIVAEGPSYSVALDGERGAIRIWRRPDLPTDEGAKIMQEMTREIGGLLTKVRSLLFDLREAPPVSGPTSVEALGHVARACERARIRVAVLIADDAMQRLQVNRVVKECAPEMARVFSTPQTERDAEPWLART
jgi:hypothetical protein